MLIPSVLTPFLPRSLDSSLALLWEKRDKRVDGMLLMDSPWPTVAICIIYVYAAKVLGPRWMASRRAFDLRYLMIVYNAWQVLFTTYMIYWGLWAGWLFDYSFICQPMDFSDSPKALTMAWVCHVYFITRFSDFLDTVFIVLRKKFDHVSPLHLIHHATMPMSVWSGVRYTPGGHASFFGLVNACVHVVMYSYYFIAALGPNYKHLRSWKRFLTLFQIAQFCIVFLHEFQLIFNKDCDIPKGFSYFVAAHAVMFLILFSDFYYVAYIRKKSAKRDERDERKND